MGEFLAWYWKHLSASFGNGVDLAKSIPGWILLILGGAMLFCPFWIDYTSETIKQIEGSAKYLPSALVILLIIVFGPLWHAFKESKTADAENKVLTEKIAAGPVVRMDDIRLDKYAKVFEMQVKNDGNGEVVARVFAVLLQDKDGERIERIDEPIELHWRGLKYGEKKRLFKDIKAFAGILTIGHIPTQGGSIGPVLFLMPPYPDVVDQNCRPYIPLLTEPILDYRHQDVILTIRVDFYDEKGERMLVTKETRHRISPDAASDVGYCIVTH